MSENRAIFRETVEQILSDTLDQKAIEAQLLRELPATLYRVCSAISSWICCHIAKVVRLAPNVGRVAGYTLHSGNTIGNGLSEALAHVAAIGEAHLALVEFDRRRLIIIHRIVGSLHVEDLNGAITVVGKERSDTSGCC